ncbi:MAG: glycosyltransferase family 2 protein [Spirochaetota bacterium]|nr:glycosyltransferase family 2 protein [Spirochaetota bacterium]
MKVTIITVVYNGQDTIQDTIESVLTQTYENIEYIIIDGNSNDGTVEIIKSYGKKISKFISEPDNGIYDAMNKGIGFATGDLIGFLNSDDLYLDASVIEKVVNTIESNKSNSCYGDLIYFDKNDNDKIIRNWHSDNYYNGIFKRGWHPPHPTFFVRKNIYEKFGNFNLEFKIAADYELMLRFLEKCNVSTCYIPETLVKMRIGGTSNRNIKNIIIANIECYKAWKVNNLQYNPLMFISKPLSKIQQFNYKKKSIWSA